MWSKTPTPKYPLQNTPPEIFLNKNIEKSSKRFLANSARRWPSLSKKAMLYQHCLHLGFLSLQRPVREENVCCLRSSRDWCFCQINLDYDNHTDSLLRHFHILLLYVFVSTRLEGLISDLCWSSMKIKDKTPISSKINDKLHEIESSLWFLT